MTLPSRYGVSLGGYKPIPQEPKEIPLEGGINLSDSPAEIEEGEVPDAVDTLFDIGGISPAYGQTLLGTRYAGGADKTIIGISEFQRKNLSTVLVRHRPTEWDRWNGANWLTLSGTALTGIAADRLYSVVMSDKLVVANKVDKLKSWDGNDVNPVQDLSADSPVAYFIAPIGNRLVAARVKVGGSIDPYKVQWSTDGDITDWTTANLGAGTSILEPEGKTGASEFITGMSALETALVLYRSRSIMLGMRTGVGSQPFRFTTVVFGLGTDACYSIANGGAQLGDFFLGSDMNVYLFDGKSVPKPIGAPIHPWLRSFPIDPFTGAFGQVDRRLQEYWLMVYNGSTWIAWIFNIATYVKTGRLVWRRRDLGANWTTLGFGATQSTINPVVDSVLAIVNTVNSRVDEYGVFGAEQRLLLGDNNGGVTYQDRSLRVATGYFSTKQYGTPESEVDLDKVFLRYTAGSLSTVEVSVSLDGGAFVNPKVLTLPQGQNSLSASTWFSTMCKTYQFRVRLLSGDATIYRIRITGSPGFRSAA